MGGPGTVDIDNPQFPVKLSKAWHAQATFLVPYEQFVAWRRAFPQSLLNDRFDEFLPAQYTPSLVDGSVQLTFFYVNHLTSDLGSYFHVGILVRAVPVDLRGALPGYYIGLEVVDQPFTWIAGYKIWGYAKVLGRIGLEGSVQGGDDRITVTLALPRQQPDRDREKVTYRFDPDSCTDKVMTMTIPKPRGTVLPYERDVYSHTLHGPSAPEAIFPCETRFRRSSVNEGVEPWAKGVHIQFHSGNRYGDWFGELGVNRLACTEVRWAPQMSGEWSKWRKVQ